MLLSHLAIRATWSLGQYEALSSHWLWCANYCIYHTNTQGSNYARHTHLPGKRSGHLQVASGAGTARCRNGAVQERRGAGTARCRNGAVQERRGAGTARQRKNMRTMLNRYAIVKLIMHVTCRWPSERLHWAVLWFTASLPRSLSGAVHSVH